MSNKALEVIPMNNNSISVESAYKQKRDCIIIALTGRTGSGCSTVAKILSSKSFNELDLHTPNTFSYKNADDRKYTIIHQYMSENDHWIPFTVIEGSAILFSFVLQEGYDQFVQYLKTFEEVNDSNKVRIGSFPEVLRRIENIKDRFNTDFIDIQEVNLTTCSAEEVGRYYQYYIVQLPRIKQELENILKNYTCYGDIEEEDSDLQFKEANLYSFIMQSVGNNIRSSGNPYNNLYDGKHYYSVAQRIEKIIQLVQKKSGSNIRICIDAIRNPYEAFYFKDKYSSFYLVSVNTDDKARKERLSFLDASEIESLDKKEYLGKHDNEYDIFYHQNISGCLEITDIHLYNPQETCGKLYFLTEQILKYVSLMIHPGLVTPSNIERCMQLAYTVKLNSGCLSRQVGAVITDCDYSAKAVGWNDVPAGQVSCNLRDVCSYCVNKDSNSYSTFEIEDKSFSDALNGLKKKIDPHILQGRTMPFCFKDVYNSLKKNRNQVYTRSLHAEENAFLQLSKYGGVGIQGGYLFTTASPCELCSKKAYQLGINDIFYIDPYPGISFSHILSFGKDNNPTLHPFYGAIGNAYISLFTQRIPIKDELELLTGISGKRSLTYLRDENIHSTLGVQDAKYVSRKILFALNSRDSMSTREECILQAKKDDIDRIPIAFYWSGDYFGEIEVVMINDSQTVPVRPSEETRTHQSYKGYIMLNRPLKKGEICHYAITVKLRDTLHVMKPYYAQYISIQTDFISIELKAPQKMLTMAKGILYADQELSPSKKVEEKQLEMVHDDQFCSYNYIINNPNLNCSYCVEWNYTPKMSGEGSIQKSMK